MKESQEKFKIIKNLGGASHLRAKKNAKFSKNLAERLASEQRKCEKEKNLGRATSVRAKKKRKR